MCIRDSISSERYAFDFSDEMKEGWRQYDTREDAWYYGIWFNPAKLQILTYAEGDLTLETCEDWGKFCARMRYMDKFYGAPPPAFFTASGIGASNGKITLENPEGYWDENARLDYQGERPDPVEPTSFVMIKILFMKGA